MVPENLSTRQETYPHDKNRTGQLCITMSKLRTAPHISDLQDFAPNYNAWYNRVAPAQTPFSQHDLTETIGINIRNQPKTFEESHRRQDIDSAVMKHQKYEL